MSSLVRDRFAVVVALALPVLLGAAIFLAGGFSSVELESLSLRFDARGERPAPGSVALVAWDQASVEALQERWGPPPYPRRIWARVLKRLERAGAGPVAFDVVFASPTPKGPDRGPGDDRTLSLALEDYGRTAVAFMPEVFSWLPGGRERFDEISTVAGAIAYGGDGSSAGLVPGMKAKKVGYPTLGIAAAALVRKKVETPRPDADGNLLLNYYGPPGTISRVDLSDLLDPGVPDAQLARALRGKVVLVGTDDPLSDDRPRPTTAPGDGAMSGVEIHATTAANALEGSFLTRLPAPAALALIAVMGLALPASALARRGRGLSLAVGLGLPVLFVAFTYLAFTSENVVVPVVGPVAAFLASIGSWLYLRHRRTERDLGELRRRFADFEPELVGGVLAGTLDEGGLDAEMIVPGYRLEAVIGRGAMGVVYRAEEVASGRPAAIKIIRPDLSDNPHFRERFQREARLSAALEHPNVLPVFSSGDEDGMLYLATRLVEGPNLAQQLAEDGPLPDAEVSRVVDGVASALDRAHGLGLVHRDVKPANILLDEHTGGHPYLTDFGIATMAGEKTLTEAGGVLGTVGFAAPEQLAGRASGPPADIYGLGAVAFAALCGGQGPPAQLAGSDEQEWPAAITGRPRVAAVLRTALASDPADRYKSASAFADALDEALAAPENE